MKKKLIEDIISKDDYDDRLGYKSDFISPDKVVPLPDFSSVTNVLTPKIKSKRSYEIPYYNFSVILHKKRKFPLFTACNIYGKYFKDTRRKNSWRIDPRVKEYQWGNKLYAAKKSDFDKGHMTRREDPAWGKNLDTAFKADQDTFHYTNAVPQVHKLNAYTWKELEDQVLHFGAVTNGLRICVFTGPVLAENDLTFVTKIDGNSIQIPSKFWKIIVWDKKAKGLHAVGFVMDQSNSLIEDKIVKSTKSLNKKRKLEIALVKDFENIQFKDRKTYQVPINYIEKITKIRFNWDGVVFPYTGNRAIEMIAEKIPKKSVIKAKSMKRKKSQVKIKDIIL
jgi:endonuclease G, mitochondrial